MVLHAPERCFKRFSEDTSHGVGVTGTIAALPPDLISGMCSVFCHQLRLDLARELSPDTAPTTEETHLWVWHCPCSCCWGAVFRRCTR